MAHLLDKDKKTGSAAFSKPLEEIVINPDTKKEYIKGKFLGKVIMYILYSCWCCCCCCLLIKIMYFF